MNQLKYIVLSLTFFSSFSSFATSFPNIFNDTIVNFGQVTDNVYRGARLTQESDYQQLESYGIHTIINLEDRKGDNPLMCAKYHMDCERFPIPLGSGVGSDINFDYEMLKKAFQSLIAKADLNEKVYLHCHYGRDRSGALAAAVTIRQYGCANNQKDALWQKIETDLTNFGYHFDWYQNLTQAMQSWVDTPPNWICN